MDTFVHKKRYEKPMLQDVKLRLEEAVLGTGCKTAELASGPQSGQYCIAAPLGSDICSSLQGT